MKSWRNSSIAIEMLRKHLMQEAFLPAYGHSTASERLEELLVCEPEGVARAEARLVEDHSAHVLFCGPAGAGKSHCAETLVRRLVERHHWRVVRLPSISHFVQGYAEFVSVIAERDGNRERDWEEPTPSVEDSVDSLRARERETGQPLALLLEDLPGVIERILRGADIRRFANLMRDLRIGVVATAQTTRLGRAARPLLGQFTQVRIGELDPDQADELIRRCASNSGGDANGRAIANTRTLRPLLGGNPRLITTLYRIACNSHGADRGSAALEQLLSGLLEHMAPHFQAQLDALSPQQALVLTRLASAPGPMPAARLGRQCELPTSHTTAILDVLLQRQLVVRVPGPGKRNVYALADRLQRLFIAAHARVSARAEIATLSRFFAQALSTAERKQALADMRATFAQVLRARLAPQLGDTRAAVVSLASVLRARDEDPGTRVMAAFLAQPEGSHDVAQLRATTRSADPTRASGPERAVAHVALAAHCIQTDSCREAADELTRALALAPNWRDLAATAFLADLAAGRCRAALSETPRLAAENSIAASILAAAEFFAGAPTAAEQLRSAIERGGPAHAPVWRAVAAVLPVNADMRERAMEYFEAVSASYNADQAILGMACVYACDSGEWPSAARYAARRHAVEPLTPESWPAWAWLTAMSGDLVAFVDIASQCERIDRAPRWLLTGLSMAARTASDPQWAADKMAELVRARARTADEMAALYGGLLLIRERVSTEWLAEVSRALHERVGHEPEPFRAFREFVASGEDERMLRTMHPEIREAVDYLRAI